MYDLINKSNIAIDNCPQLFIVLEISNIMKQAGQSKPRRPTFIEVSRSCWDNIRDDVRERFADGMKTRIHSLGNNDIKYAFNSLIDTCFLQLVIYYSNK